MVQVPGQTFIKDFIDQRAFSGTGYTGDTGKDTDRELNIDIFKVIFSGSTDRQPAHGLAPCFGYRDTDTAA